MNERVASGQRGRFWVADSANPSREVVGTLQFAEPLAGRIELDGTLYDGGDTPRPIPVVHGVLFSGKRITAYECYTGGRHGIHGKDHVVRETLTVMTFVIGEHLGVDAVFDTLTVSLGGLREWADFDRGWEWDSSHSPGQETVRYNRPAERGVSLPDRRVVRLVSDTTLGVSSYAVAANEVTAFCVTFPEPVDLKEVASITGALRDLIAFATRRATEVLTVTLTAPGVWRVPELQLPEELDWRSTMVVRVLPDGGYELAESWLNFLFRLPDAPAGYEDLLLRWFDLIDKLGVMLDLFLGLYHAPPHFLENKVMNVCQAAEGFHRRLHDHHTFTDEEYAALKKRLREACPEEHRKWLDGWLSHGNAPSFRQRIEELIEKAGRVGRLLADSDPTFSSKLRNHRDTYAHWLADSKSHDTDPVELVGMYDRTHLLLEACLLQDLGWSADAASDAVSRLPSFGRVAPAGSP